LPRLPPSRRHVRHTRFHQLAAPDPDGRPMMAWGQNAWNKVLRNPSAMIIANTATQSALRLVSNIILARLLDPSAFALTAITSLILTGIQMVSDVGIAITALREGELSREDEDRLWTMQLVRGIGVGVLVAAIAVPVGWIYQDTRLRDVLFALALMPALQGAQSLYPILALAHRRLLPSTLVELGGRIVAMTASIFIALISPTVWSLVIGTLLAVVFTTFASHMLSGRLPRFILDRDYIRRQWAFARWIQTSSTLSFVGMQIDKALFPFLFGITALGLYGIGATFATIPAQITQRWSSSIFYPLTVQLLKGDAGARAQLLGVRTTMLLYSAIVTLGVMAISPSFFLLLYEPQYHAAAVFAQILALGTFFEVAESSLRHMPLVEGTPHFEVWTVVVRLAAFSIAVLVVHFTDAGVASYALSYVIGLAASYGLMVVVCVRRGYIQPSLDIMLTVALAVAATALYALPLPRGGAIELVLQAMVVAAISAVALALVYLRRGLPSLPAEPARETLLETAEDDLGTFPKRA
jgi:O-antigen/teichoic acid export membrane protein